MRDVQRPARQAPTLMPRVLAGARSAIDASAPPRILICGASSPVAVTLLRSLRVAADVMAADEDCNAVGFFLVSPGQRRRIPCPDSPDYIAAVLSCAVAERAALVIPTRDSALGVMSRAAGQFRARGIDVLVASPETLAVCTDRLWFMGRCAPVVRVPRTIPLDPETTSEDLAQLGQPVVVASRATRRARIMDTGVLPTIRRDGTLLAQEYLPGVEYSIDVLARPDRSVLAAVPRIVERDDEDRVRLGRAVHDPELQHLARNVANAVGATSVISVRTKGGSDGAQAVVGVTPRFPDTLALTIAAGVNMPLIAVGDALGRSLVERSPGRTEPQLTDVDGWSVP